LILTPADIAAAEAIRFPDTGIRKIVCAVAEASGVDIDRILSATRVKSVVRARDIVCYIAHREGYSMTMIGQCIGGRDHGTIGTAIAREKARRGEE
jgi:chromosomal replication initiation ATPase DnaA